jgi:hypothetical protein
MGDLTSTSAYAAPTGWKQNAVGIPQLQAPTNPSAGFFANSLPPPQTPLPGSDIANGISDLVQKQTEAMKQMISALAQNNNTALPSGSKSTKSKSTHLETTPTTSPPIPVVISKKIEGRRKCWKFLLPTRGMSIRHTRTELAGVLSPARFLVLFS